MNMSDDVSRAAPTRRRLATKRRANAEPYTRRSHRHVTEDTTQRPTSERGFFSRLMRYIPIVGKMVANDDEDDEEYIEENDEEENEANDASTHSDGDNDQVSTDNTTGEHERTNEVSSSQQHQTSNGSVALIQTTPSSRERPPTLNAVGKTSTSSVSRELVPQRTQPIKTLKFADGVANTFAFRRSMVGRRRHHPIYNTETAMSVIKQRKAISLAEYERLSSQLRSLVDRTPVNRLALTRTDQDDRHEENSHLTLTENGESSSSSNKRWSSEQSVAALPSSKRARPSIGDTLLNLPVVNTSAHIDRSSRKPRPSRLLTGEKRDAASRSAYSAAVAEKVLSTLKKIETPLDQETFKPRPSTSLSWAQHHLALSRNQTQDVKMLEGTSDEDAPPTATVAKVAHASAAFSMPLPNARSTAPIMSMETPSTKSKAANGNSPFFSPPSISMTPASDSSSTLRMQNQATTVQSKDSKDGQYSFCVPPPSESPLVNQFDEDTLQYYFSPPPALREPPKQAPKLKKRNTEHATATPFAFMPASPKMRAELTKSTPAKAKFTSIPSTVTAATTSLNPLARFMQMEEGAWKCPSCCVVNGVTCNKCPCCETNKPSVVSSAAGSVAVPASTSTSVTTSVDSTNPLARFMKVPEGSWKCPTCSVTNEHKHNKCPCCETIKPGAEKTTTATTKTNGFHFGIAPSEDKPSLNSAPATKVASSAIGASSGGFTFQAPTVTADPATKPAFMFGAATSATSSSLVPQTTGFVFGSNGTVPPPTKQTDNTPSFAFGTSKGGEATDNVLKATTKQSASAFSNGSNNGGGFALAVKDAAKPATGFSFGASSTAQDVVQPTPSFSFGAPTTSNTQSTSRSSFAAVSKVTEESDTIVDKGVVLSSTPSILFAPRVESKPLSDPKVTTLPEGNSSALKPSAAPALPFGSSAESKPVPAKELEPPTQSTPAFTFGKPFVNANESTEGFTATTTKEVVATPSVKQPSFVFGQAPASDTKASESTAKPAFSFGVSTTTASSQPGFTFGSSAGSKSEAAPPKPAFTFGQSSDGAAKPEAAPPKPAFTFGQLSDTATKESPAFSASTPSAPAFTFGGTTTQPKSTPASTVFGNSPYQQTASFGNSAPSFGHTGKEGSASASSGFGSSGTFGADATASTGFGAPSAPSETPAFGSTTAPSTTPAFLFGSPPQASAPTQPSFGFNASTTPSPFTTATTDGFSSSNAFGASSGSVGGNPNSGFGASSASFGASAPSTFSFGAGGGSSSASSTATFGAPAVAIPPAFRDAAYGAPSSGFGAPAPAPSFGVPTPTVGGFGAPPSNASQFGAPPAFGASQDAGTGGFSMGQAPTKRRILKAKRKSNVPR